MSRKSFFIYHLALIASLFVYTNSANAITAEVVEQYVYKIGEVTPGHTITSDLVSHSGGISFKDEFIFTFDASNSSNYTLLGAIDFSYTSSDQGFSNLFISFDGGKAINYLDFDYGQFVEVGSISTAPALKHSIVVFGDTLSGGANYSLSVAAVPETEIWGMMLAGLGIMGLKLRRRNRVRACI